MSQDELTAIIDRVALGRHSEADVEALRQVIENKNGLLLQLGKYNISIGESGEGIHIGDRTYIEINDDALKAIALTVEASNTPKREPKQEILLNWTVSQISLALETSLKGKVPLLLGLESDQSFVQPFEVISQKLERSFPVGYSTTKSIVDIFDDSKTSGRLLILGEPGSGKTHTLFMLAKELAYRAKINPNCRIPLILRANSWKDDKKEIKEWLLEELNDIGIKENIGRKWLEDEIFILLLDGLDEIEPRRQRAFIKKLNKFLKPKNWKGGLVISSRSKEYEVNSLGKEPRRRKNDTGKLRKKTQRLGLNTCVILRPLSIEQVEKYTKSNSKEEFWETLLYNSSLLELCRTPLFLNIILVSLSERDFVKRWDLLNSEANKLSFLFDTYINQSFNLVEEERDQFDQHTTRKWLGWLSRELSCRGESVFSIEQLDIDWLSSAKEKKRFRQLSLTLYASLYSLLIFVVWSCNLSLTSALGTSIFNFLIIRFLAAPMRSNEIKPVETIRFSFKTFISYLPYIFISSIVLASLSYNFFPLVIILLKSSLSHTFDTNVFWKIWTIIFLISTNVILLFSFKGPDLNLKTYPNEGLIKNLKNSLTLAIIGFPVNLFLGLLLNLWLPKVLQLPVAPEIISIDDLDFSYFANYGLVSFAFSFLESHNLLPEMQSFFGVEEISSVGFFLADVVKVFIYATGASSLFAFQLCGFPTIQHFCLRYTLSLSNKAPFRYVAFLNHATDRVLLQRAGNKFVFLHRFLQEYFSKGTT